MKKYGIIIAFVLLSLVVAGCGSSNAVAGVPKAPSGKNCTENVAYLQGGVDRYKQAVGAFPADVKELAVAKEGKGPFVEKVPACPSGNRYVIKNGKVGEAPPL